MNMQEKLYQRILCVWLGSGLLLLSGWLIYKVLTTPFEAVNLLLGWLVLGLILVVGYGIAELWNADLYID